MKKNRGWCTTRVPQAGSDVVRIQRCVGAGEFWQNHETLASFKVPFPLSTRIAAWQTEEPGMARVTDEDGVRLSKSEMAIGYILARYSPRIGIQGTITHAVKPGRGCMTSSVDVHLAATAALLLLGVTLDARWLNSIMSKIEPSDPVIRDGMTCCWSFTTGRRLSPMYRVPPGGYILVLPRTAVLDTGDLAGRRPRYTDAQRCLLDSLQWDLRRALGVRSLTGVAAVASRSADINARFIPNPSIKRFREMTAEGEIGGYATAHSGTCAVAMTPPGQLQSSFHMIRSELGLERFDFFGYEYRLEHDEVPFLAGPGGHMIKAISSSGVAEPPGLCADAMAVNS